MNTLFLGIVIFLIVLAVSDLVVGVSNDAVNFLNNNGILYREDGSKRLADNTLVALTLMIAESKTEEKDVMVKVVVNLINQKN